MKTLEWSCLESEKWTRKGFGDQKNSNIDIIMTHLIRKEDIEIKFLDKIDISDHVPIEIVIQHENWIWKEL